MHNAEFTATIVLLYLNDFTQFEWANWTEFALDFNLSLYFESTPITFVFTASHFDYVWLCIGHFDLNFKQKT